MNGSQIGNFNGTELIMGGANGSTGGGRYGWNEGGWVGQNPAAVIAKRILNTCLAFKHLLP